MVYGEISCDNVACGVFVGAWAVDLVLWFGPFAAIFMWRSIFWTSTLLTAIGSHFGRILLCCVSCFSLPCKSRCCAPLKSVGGLRTTVMAPYRRENKGPLPMRRMTSGNGGTVEQGSRIEMVVEGYPVVEGYIDQNNERFV